MKRTLIWIGILVVAVSCSTQKQVAEKKARPVEIEQKDSVQYDLETFDGRFETWYILQNNPAQYHSQSYYKMWNQRYVSAWDEKAMNPQRNPFFEPIVGYNPATDYGFELNHKLFYYFQYVEHVLKIPILSDGPHVVLF